LKLVRGRWLIAWYGPAWFEVRLLLVLLAVFAKAPGSQYLFRFAAW